MEEIWKDIEGYEGLYQVSNFGRVRSLDRVEPYRNGGTRKRKGNMKILHKNKDEYVIITLCKCSKHKTFTVHKLVWTSFVGPIPEGYEINHKDERPENNRLDNLNLLTHKQNINWGTGIQRHSFTQRNRPVTSKVVNQYSIDGIFIKQWPSTKEIERTLGFGNTSISKCCIGKLKTAYGFKWQYAA